MTCVVHFVIFFTLSYFFTNYKEKIGKTNKENNHVGTPKLWLRHHRYCLKDLNKINSTTSKNVTNGKWNGSHKLSKGVGAYLSLDRSCSSLQSPLVTFLSIVRFVLSRSFQRYQWCLYQSFGVSLRSFSFFLSFLSFLFLYWILCPIILQIERVADDTNNITL